MQNLTCQLAPGIHIRKISPDYCQVTSIDPMPFQCWPNASLSALAQCWSNLHCQSVASIGLVKAASIGPVLVCYQGCLPTRLGDIPHSAAGYMCLSWSSDIHHPVWPSCLLPLGLGDIPWPAALMPAVLRAWWYSSVCYPHTTPAWLGNLWA